MAYCSRCGANPCACDDDDRCPGAGKCHGCMCWCDVCGDVDTTCNYPTCQRHHCCSCGELFGRDDHYEHETLCNTCAIAAINEDAIQQFERHLKFGEFDKADVVARDLFANPTPFVGTMARPWGAW